MPRVTLNTVPFSQLLPALSKAIAPCHVNKAVWYICQTWSHPECTWAGKFNTTWLSLVFRDDMRILEPFGSHEFQTIQYVVSSLHCQCLHALELESYVLMLRYLLLTQFELKNDICKLFRVHSKQISFTRPLIDRNRNLHLLYTMQVHPLACLLELQNFLGR